MEKKSIPRRLVMAGGLAVTMLVASVSAAVAAPVATEPGVVSSCAQPAKPGWFRCLALKRTDVAATRAKVIGYTPHDLRAAYQLPSSTTTATVAVVDAYDHPNAESDLGVYRKTFGLPPCTTANGCFRKVNQLGAAAPLPAANAHWAGEISLDTDMVSAVCPSCHILLVEADDESPNLIAAVQTAVAMGAQYVSMSWGTPEVPAETAVDPMFAQPGVVFTAASGDSGYAGGVVYPAASPNVVAVGGTSLHRAPTPRGWFETAWSKSGSGCSAYLPKPAFQRNVSACSTRADSDVAAVGDPDTGVAVYQTYGDTGWGVDGGTSAAAPIIAAVYALAGAAGGEAQPASLPYSRRRGLNDVFIGSTGQCSIRELCTARFGWDGPTGLGTPRGISAFRR